MDFEFKIDNKSHTISLEEKENHFVVSEADKTYKADIQLISPNSVSIKIIDQTHQVYFARDKDKYFLQIEGQQSIVQEPSGEGENFLGEEGKSQEDMLVIKAPMPGKVIKINVAEKEEVRKNQTLAIVEAMKMENEIKSSIAGYVKSIFISPGDLVDSDKPLIELEKKE